MSPTRQRRHHQWLIDTVVEAGLPVEPPPPDLHGLDLTQAWQAVG